MDGMRCSEGDHPRVCGEYRTQVKTCTSGMGSPPRVRGVPAVRYRCPVWLRITPACAGSTCGSVSLSSVATDHPRVCGEYYSLIKSEGVIQGSPPRVRGVHDPGHFPYLLFRITPACAGSTYVRSHYVDLIKGSPPRVRGVPKRPRIHELRDRITPACAGSTGYVLVEEGRREDHPRVCGEYG